jgi:transcriptional regulator with XRE-family HTH domain
MGARLRAARKAAGMNQEQLAERAGINQSTVSDIENDEQGTAYAPELAAPLGVEALWLKTGKGPRKRLGGAIDPIILRDVLIGIEAGAAGFAETPERKARIAAAAYQWLMLHPEAKPDAELILKLLRDLL